MGVLEKLGLLKMDFLGLSNLTVIARTVESVRQRRGVELDMRTLEDGDPETYAMLGRGETIGVFQLEGGGMTRYVQQLKPANVRELTALVALYRPGPMEHIPRYIDCKFGRADQSVIHPLMAPILEETYGVIVFQDQVLQLLRALAGFSLGRADVLRRAMGKKDAKAMAEMKGEFVAGCQANGIPEAVIDQVWTLLLPFAGYAFNKAHSVCYALLAYQTAYLKANYLLEYMAALLSAYRTNESRVITCIEECRRLKCPVLPPDVNASQMDFAVDGAGIRFGLVAIKGVGEGVAQGIIDERTEGGPYVHLFEFAERCKQYGLNRTALEALVKAGALDSIDPNRARSLEALEGALGWAESANRSRLAGQDSLFGEAQAPAASRYPPITLETPPPGRGELLAMEKEVMGIYVSDHPLRGHQESVQQASSHGCGTVVELEDGAQVRLAGVISGLRSMVTKSRGERMAMLTLEDFTGQASILVFPKVYERVKDRLHKDAVVKLTGVVVHRDRPGAGGERSVEVRLEEISPLEPHLDFSFDDLPMPAGAPGTVTIKIFAATTKQLMSLKSTLSSHPGEYPVIVKVGTNGGFAPVLADVRVDPDQVRELVKRIPMKAVVEVS